MCRRAQGPERLSNSQESLTLKHIALSPIIKHLQVTSNSYVIAEIVHTNSD